MGKVVLIELEGKNINNFAFNYGGSLGKNKFIVDSVRGNLNVKGNTNHCLYNFNIKLDPLIPKETIILNETNCQVKIKDYNNLLLSNNSKLYNPIIKTIEINNFNLLFYFIIFIVIFLFTITIIYKKYAKELKYIIYGENKKQ